MVANSPAGCMSTLRAGMSKSTFKSRMSPAVQLLDEFQRRALLRLRPIRARDTSRPGRRADFRRQRQLHFKTPAPEKTRLPGLALQQNQEGGNLLPGIDVVGRNVAAGPQRREVEKEDQPSRLLSAGGGKTRCPRRRSAACSAPGAASADKFSAGCRGGDGGRCAEVLREESW